MELEVYKKSDFYEDYISSQKEYYERENADAYFAEKLAEKDKEIADLEESHKMEVEQLLMEIVGLKNKLQAANEQIENLVNSASSIMLFQDKVMDNKCAELRHHKYKRCLNKAEWCEERCARYDLLQEHSGFSWRREIDFYFRWYKVWMELAEKFKEAK